jgi:methylphosphotriester-DNA--protein-cysteine methyltransferase
MESAMKAKDPAFDGKFYVGVHSTGIFCLPSCRARPPLLKNVRFYASAQAARAAGLRACKRCRPDRFPDTRPDWVEQLTSFLRSHPGTRLSEGDLARLAGVDITTIRRYFKQQHHTTPLAFHRRIRLEHARELIAAGASYLTAAYECGYESASGFRDAFARQFGRPPGRMHEHRSHRLS